MPQWLGITATALVPVMALIIACLSFQAVLWNKRMRQLEREDNLRAEFHINTERHLLHRMERSDAKIQGIEGFNNRVNSYLNRVEPMLQQWEFDERQRQRPAQTE